MRRDKREARITVNAPPEIKRAILEAAKREDRTISHWFLRLAEQHPGVQIALQRIGASGGGH